MEEDVVKRKSLVNIKVKLWIPQTAGYFFRMKIGKARRPETSGNLPSNAA
jgi:hypothetical protein